MNYIEVWPLNLTFTVNNVASKFISFLPNSISLYDIRCLITGQNQNFEPKFSDLWPSYLMHHFMNAVSGESVALKTQVVEILLHEKSTLPTNL